MTDEARAVRNLREDITAAQHQLNQARRDGNAERILRCARRVDELLDRWPIVNATHSQQH